MADEEVPGPIDFVLIEFPSGAPTTATADALSDLLDRGIVRLYDIAILRKTGDGATEMLDVGDPDVAGVGAFSAFAGARSGLFDDEDAEQASAAMEPDTTALLIAYENEWAEPFVEAAHSAGGRMIASQRIPAQVLLDALDGVESQG